MSNPVEPDKPDLAAQAEVVSRDYPALAPVLTAFANDIGALQARIFALEMLLKAHLDASRPHPLSD
jgi:hypothetical protein